ncbi:MAG: TetR/AcrR family transcriptional regulator, partial [Cyclobacteriaceae bacterium]|nr:TetR/AcrR family transcriptional regulator [Cyclobacteriaceae bacterium]
QAIFETAKELFWKYGIRRVTIEEICKEAGVSKMTFYKFFPNKVALANTILEKIMDESLGNFEDIVNSDLPFTEKVKNLFKLKLEVSKDISIEFINDVNHGPHSELVKSMEAAGLRSQRIFVDFLLDSQSRGLIRKGIKIDFILHYLNYSQHIMEDEQLRSLYDHPQDLIMEAMDFLFYGLMPHQ